MHIVFGDLHVTTKRFAKRKNKYVPIGKETEMVIEKNVLLVKKINEKWRIVEQVPGQTHEKIQKHLTKSQRILEVKAVIYNNLKSKPAYQYQTFSTDFAVKFVNEKKL